MLPSLVDCAPYENVVASPSKPPPPHPHQGPGPRATATSATQTLPRPSPVNSLAHQTVKKKIFSEHFNCLTGTNRPLRTLVLINFETSCQYFFGDAQSRRCCMAAWVPPLQRVFLAVDQFPFSCSNWALIRAQSLLIGLDF